MPNFRSFGGKTPAASFRSFGGKALSYLYGGYGAKAMLWGSPLNQLAWKGITTIAHSTGLGGMSDGSYMAGNTHHAVANGLNDRRPITSYQNAVAAARNVLERQSKRQRGGL